MKLNLTSLGLSKNIQSYWNKINYNPSPDEWALLICNFSTIPAYKKIDYLTNLVNSNLMDFKYMKFSTDFITDYNTNVESFVYLNNNQFYTVILDSDNKFNIPDYAGNSFNEIMEYTKSIIDENGSVNSFTLFKNNMIDKLTSFDDYSYIDSYITYDRDFNIIDYSFNNMRSLPIIPLDLPTDFTNNDVYKLVTDHNFDKVLIGLDCPDDCIRDNGYVVKLDSSSDKFGTSMYYNLNTGNFMEDHVSPILLERLTDDDLSELEYSGLYDLLLKYRHDCSKLISEINIIKRKDE